MRVLLISGYAEAAHKDAEGESIAILPKPFRIVDLAKAFTLSQATP